MAASGAFPSYELVSSNLTNPIVVFLYETFVTLDREVACFWTGKWTGAPLLFLANKWISTTIFVMDVAHFAPFPSDKVSGPVSCWRGDVSPKAEVGVALQIPDAAGELSVRSCSLWNSVAYAISVMQFVPGAGTSYLQSQRFVPYASPQVFSALRAYVLSRSKVLGIAVGALSLAPVGANLVSACTKV